MTRMILASTALLAIAGAAVAQEAPALIYGDSYSQTVQNAGDGSAVDFSASASMSRPTGEGGHRFSSSVNGVDNYFGR